MKTFLKPRNSLTLLFVAALVIAVLVPQPMAFGLDEPPFEIPLVLYAALIGVISSFLTAGLKDRFPKIADAIAVLVSAVVTTVLDFLTGVVNMGVPPLFWPLIIQGCLILASWLATWATYRIFIRPRLLPSINYIQAVGSK